LDIFDEKQKNPRTLRQQDTGHHTEGYGSVSHDYHILALLCPSCQEQEGCFYAEVN